MFVCAQTTCRYTAPLVRNLTRRTFFSGSSVGASLPGLMYESMMFIGNVQTEMNLMEKSLNHGCRSVLITSTVEQKGTGYRATMGYNNDPSAGNTVGTGGVTVGTSSTATGRSFKPHLQLYERIRDLRTDLADADDAAGVSSGASLPLFLCHRFRNVPAFGSAAPSVHKPPPQPSVAPAAVEVVSDGVVSIASLLRQQKEKVAAAQQKATVAAVGTGDVPRMHTQTQTEIHPWAGENSTVRAVMAEHQQIHSALGGRGLSVATVPCFDISSHAKDAQRWVQKLIELAARVAGVGGSASSLQELLVADVDLQAHLDNCRTLHKYMNSGSASDVRAAPQSLGLDISTELVHAVTASNATAGDEGSMFGHVVTYLYRELAVINNSALSGASSGEAGRATGTVIGVGVNTYAFYAVNAFTVGNAFTRDAVIANHSAGSHMRYVWTETLRSHERKPGLIINSDMAGVNNRSVYGNSNSSSSSVGDQNANSDAKNNIDLLGSMPSDQQREQNEIDAMIAECIEELQQGWKSCFKLEQIYNDKSEEKPAAEGGRVYTKWLYGHVLAATQHTILYPEEWLYIYSTTVDPAVNYHLKLIKDGLIANNSHSLRDWTILYTPLVKQFFSVYERFLHARKRSILFDIRTSNHAAFERCIRLVNSATDASASASVPALDIHTPVSTALMRLLQQAGNAGTAAFVTVGDAESASNTVEAQWRQQPSGIPAEEGAQPALTESQELLMVLLQGMERKLTTVHAGVSAPGSSVLTSSNHSKPQK